MEGTIEKLRTQIEKERTFLNHLAEENITSEKTLAQSRLMDALIASLYEQQELSVDP